MATTSLLLCLLLGLAQAIDLKQVRSASPIPPDGSPPPIDCTEELWNSHPGWGSFRPHTADNSGHLANCSRFWRCDSPMDGKQSSHLYECPPCNPSDARCHGHSTLVFNIDIKNCDYPEVVSNFFVSGPCECQKCKECGGKAGGDNLLCDLWKPQDSDSCHYCDDARCLPGCLKNEQCPGELECNEHKCVAPCKANDQLQCSKDDAGSCNVCSECQATVSWSCSPSTECCAANPCGPCYDCINGNCVFRDCGDCNDCNVETDKCEPKICGGPCGVCKDDICGDCDELCDPCSTCEGGICGTPLECCSENPCDSCQDCVDGKCVDRDCGVCSSCNSGTDKCEATDCEECGVCKDDECVDCNELCPTCSTCQNKKCLIPLECCSENPCGNCQDCVDGKCVDRDCGECTDGCNMVTDKCEPRDCKECGICKDDSCVDCNELCPTCSTCEDGTCGAPLECCPENPCGNCQDCENGICVNRECGECTDGCNMNTDKCVPKDCKECGICKDDACVDCNELCPVCSTCDEGICGTPLECCTENPCNSCQDCVEGTCVDRDCGECGQCNPDTNECDKDQSQCKADCGEPDCETCVGIPGKIGFECQHVCANDDESCCCVDDDCKKFCNEQGLAPNCDCGDNKCACTQIGSIVVNKLYICTEKCEDCDYEDCEGMVLNLVGETMKDGKPECQTAKLDRPGQTYFEGNCVEFGSAMDNAICGGCYQYPLEGDLDEDSTIEWKGKGKWSGSFCVSWFPERNMDVRCEVEEGEVTDCDEVCDCKNADKVKCPNKVSVRSQRNGGIFGWLN